MPKELPFKNDDVEDVDMTEDKELDNFVEVDIEGIFIKHDFDHIIVDQDEVEKYTNGRLIHCSMKQCLFVPYEYDIQTLVYFMSAQFPCISVIQGQNEVLASMRDNGMLMGPQSGKKYDLKIVIGRENPQDKQQGVVIKYYYKAMKLKLSWLTSPRNDCLADSVSLMVLQINSQTTPQLLQMM